MGNARSTEAPSLNGSQSDNPGCLLFVALKVQKPDDQSVPHDLVLHVTGSLPILGFWDPSKAVVMQRESTNTWELSFVVPSDFENLEFKFILKSKDNKALSRAEEGANRVLRAGSMEGEAGPLAKFDLPVEYGIQRLELPIDMKADPVSPFALAASWRAVQKNLHAYESMVQGISDVSINKMPTSRALTAQSGSEALELDLEHYEVPTPATNAGVQYVAESAEDPRLLQRSVSVPVPLNGGSLYYPLRGSTVSRDQCVSIKDLVLGGSESPVMEAVNSGAATPVGETRSMASGSLVPGYVDKGVSHSSRLVKLCSDVSLLDSDLQSDSGAETMPEAAGAVAAAAVADRLLGPKERRQLAIVLVGLPARGKTFTAAKLTRYLRWLGHDTKHFNVGKYRRLKHGCSQTADFFRGDNQEGMDARNEVAALAMEDMLAWMQEGGQVGVFDATNSTNGRRNLLMKLAEGRCKVIFLETICNDQSVINTNIQLKIQQSPDYGDVPDYETALTDFKTRLLNYEKVYEPVTEGSYIKMIDMVSGEGGQMQVNNISGYLPGRIVFFLVNTHITPRPILLTRHGESQDNVTGRIGGDPLLSEAGERYALKLADFVNKRLKTERTASLWTSTLRRTLVTARHIVGFPKVQWRALDEINAGECDGMTYLEIKESMPEEYQARKLDKLRYRYPRGESYLDVIQRLEPVIIELERQRSPVVVIAHQAILRSLYAYFMDKPLKEVPHIEMPLHTIIEIQLGVTGVQEKRYKLMETSSWVPSHDIEG